MYVQRTANSGQRTANTLSRLGLGTKTRFCFLLGFSLAPALGSVLELGRDKGERANGRTAIEWLATETQPRTGMTMTKKGEKKTRANTKGTRC